MIIRTFYDLDAWQKGRELTKVIYEYTSRFPTDEKFGLVSQMRRSSISVIANIAEGFGRSSIKEKLHFYNQAHGSLAELQSHTYIASDLKYIAVDQTNTIFGLINNSQALLQGLVRSTKKRL